MSNLEKEKSLQEPIQKYRDLVDPVASVESVDKVKENSAGSELVDLGNGKSDGKFIISSDINGNNQIVEQKYATYPLYAADSTRADSGSPWKSNYQRHFSSTYIRIYASFSALFGLIIVLLVLCWVFRRLSHKRNNAIHCKSGPEKL
jgi:hypothetical protein